MMRLILAAVMTAGLMASGASAQTEPREIGPLMTLFPHWQDYLDLPAEDRSRFTLGYQISSSQGVPAEEIQVSYSAGDIRGTLELDAHGRVLNPPDTALIEAAPIAAVNQPPGSMAGRMTFEARFDDMMRISPHDAVGALDQANRAMRRVGGVAALFAPAFKTVIFVFDGPAPEAWAVRADMERTPLTVQENRVIYRPNDRDMRNVSEIVLGRAPAFILIDS
ncbi:hypothetical protein [Maricaulis sp.]|uniref:hypothetical protein n=1 Tax=Maricaulis sp. TaxID=1486257 RepID=UPI003A90884C